MGCTRITDYWCRDDATGAQIPCANCGTTGVIPVDFTDSLAMAVGGPGIGLEPGQCPMNPQGNCYTDYDEMGNPIGSASCLTIRECDPYTGMTHGQYNIGGGDIPNANTWELQSNGTWVWRGPTGAIETAPDWAAPPSLESGYNPTYVDRLQQVMIAGMQYNPSTGWTTLAEVPVQTQPGFPAFSAPVDSKLAWETAGQTDPSSGVVSGGGVPLIGGAQAQGGNGPLLEAGGIIPAGQAGFQINSGVLLLAVIAAILLLR